jgi:hypothetical protein
MEDPQDDAMLAGYCASIVRTHWRTITADCSELERAEVERVERHAESLGLTNDLKPFPGLPEEDEWPPA